MSSKSMFHSSSTDSPSSNGSLHFPQSAAQALLHLQQPSTNMKELKQVLTYFYEASNFLEVLEICRAVPGHVQKSPDLAYLHAKAHLELGEAAEAERLFWKLTELRRNPGLKAVTYMELGRLRKRQERLKEAAEFFEYAENLAANPATLVRALCEQGVLFTQLQKPEAAHTCFTQAAKQSSNPAVNACVAWCCLKTGHFDKALDLLQALQVTNAADQPYAQCKYLLALCFMSQGQLRQALELLFALLKDQQYEAVCSATCGIVFAKANQLNDALENFWRAKDLGMNEWQLWHNLRTVYMILADKDSAALAEQNLKLFKSEYEPSSSYKWPSFDPVDFLFTGTLPEYKNPAATVDFRQFTADKSTSIKGLTPSSPIAVLQTTECYDDKTLHTKPLVGLPAAPLEQPGKVTESFLQGLVRFFQRLVQQKIGRRLCSE